MIFIVVDLRAGVHGRWQGGMYRARRMLTIADVSWTADGRSLVFLGLWCQPILAPNLCASASGPSGSRAAQVRSISAGAGGGTLDRGVLLLTQSARYPVIADAVAGPAAGELDVRISPDPSGRYLLVSYGGRGGFSTGWIDHGKLRFLPITRPYLGYPITAW